MWGWERERYFSAVVMMDMTGLPDLEISLIRNAHFCSLGWIQICLYTTSGFHLRIYVSYSSAVACLQGFGLAESVAAFLVRYLRYDLRIFQSAIHPTIYTSTFSVNQIPPKDRCKTRSQFFVNLVPSILVCLLQLSCYIDLELQRNLASSVRLSVVDFT